MTPFLELMLQTHGDEHIWLRIVILDPSGFTVLRGILASNLVP